MQNHVTQLAMRLSFLLILLLSIGIVYGQKSGQEKTLSRTDSISVPKRITYLQENGVFLNERQERVTLEKLLWKEQYRQDAVSMYWVNKALEERIEQVVQSRNDLKKELVDCETQSVSAIGNMEHYRKLFKDSDAEMQRLRKENRKLLFNVRLLQVGTVGFGTLFILSTLNVIR